MKKPTILILGHGGHGKDTLAAIIEKFTGYTFTGSSKVAAEKIIFPSTSHLYSSPEEAYKDRRAKRLVWKHLITRYNSVDPSRLVKEVLSNCDGYTGLRAFNEVESCAEQGLFTDIVWVTRPDLEENDPSIDFGFPDLVGLRSKHRNFNLTFVKNRNLSDLERFAQRSFQSTAS